MARSEARLQFGMWRSGLDGATSQAKLLYCVLLTEPTLNHCGVGAIRMSRWAKDAGFTMAETEKALGELSDGQWVLLDEDTEEVFVRTLIRNDGVADQPYVLKGALREALMTVSPRLRVALAAELRRLPPRKPDGVSKSGRKVTYPDPHETADVLDPPHDPKPSRNPVERVSEVSENPSESPHGGGGGGGGGSSVGTSSTSVGPRKRGTRIPDDFAVTAEMVAWVRQHCPTVDGRTETERFTDHFRAAPGQKGVKLDWVATWRNWMRTAAERQPRTAPSRHLAPVPDQLPSDPSAAFADLRERADAHAVSRLIGVAYLPKTQPRSDDTPARVWERREALAFIDKHHREVLAAVAAKEKPA